MANEKCWATRFRQANRKSTGGFHGKSCQTDSSRCAIECQRRPRRLESSPASHFRWVGKPIEIVVTQFDELEKPRLRVVVSSKLAISDVKGCVTFALERLLGIHIDLGEFYYFGENDEVLRSLLNQFRIINLIWFRVPYTGDGGIRGSFCSSCI